MTYQLITPDCRFDAVILGNGDFPSHAVPLGILRNARHIFCCDGAGISLIERGIVPDAIIGDGDSLPQKFKEEYGHIIHIVNEQEHNDQTKATLFCRNLGYRRIAYIGATGRREDHTIGNISLLMDYMADYGMEPVMVTDHGYFIPCRGRSEFATFARQQVSIFNFGYTKISAEGLAWRTYNYRNWWQGTLNEAEGDSVTIDTDGNYIVFFTHNAKIRI
ncbi:thiamine diphosphokinase [Xylanibacter caecicola]|uniref:thiamine diphosphokinase n=1 Tax=Xylanibacter caecicola TaxID=2736294 RepID=UPI0025878DE1|nr:thiamine diphosphokinase [Xylanibacter caecicola]